MISPGFLGSFILQTLFLYCWVLSPISLFATPTSKTLIVASGTCSQNKISYVFSVLSKYSLQLSVLISDPQPHTHFLSPSCTPCLPLAFPVLLLYFLVRTTYQILLPTTPSSICPQNGIVAPTPSPLSIPFLGPSDTHLLRVLLLHLLEVGPQV